MGWLTYNPHSHHIMKGNKCLDIWQANFRNGQGLVWWNCHTGMNQKFDLVWVAGQRVAKKSVKKHKVVKHKKITKKALKKQPKVVLKAKVKSAKKKIKRIKKKVTKAAKSLTKAKTFVKKVSSIIE